MTIMFWYLAESELVDKNQEYPKLWILEQRVYSELHQLLNRKPNLNSYFLGIVD